MADSTTPRPPTSTRTWNAAPTLAAAAVFVCAFLFASPAAAQEPFLTFQQQLRPSGPKGPSLLKSHSGDAPMLVKANEIDYDYTNDRVAAVGNVQIYYNGATIEAGAKR